MNNSSASDHQTNIMRHEIINNVIKAQQETEAAQRQIQEHTEYKLSEENWDFIHFRSFSWNLFESFQYTTSDSDLTSDQSDGSSNCSVHRREQ